MGEVAGFSPEAAQNIKKAAKIVLNGGDYGSTDNAAPVSGLQCITVKLLARIDGSKPIYKWQQERRTQTGWEEVTNGLSDKDGKYGAYDLDETNTNDLSNTHVVLARGTVRGTSGNIDPGWIIIGGAAADSPCAFQYQVKIAVAANVMACDFIRLHPVLP